MILALNIEFVYIDQGPTPLYLIHIGRCKTMGP